MSIIRRTKSGNYQADVLDPFGKRIRRVFNRKKQAEAFCASIDKEKQEIRLHRGGLLRKPVLFSSVIQDALKNKEKLATKSYVKYKYVYETFEDFVNSQGLTNLHKFTAEHADNFRNIVVSSGAAAKTINFYLSTVKSIFKECVLKDSIQKNPFDHIKLERIRRKTLLEREDDYYSSEDIMNFFSQEMDQQLRNAFLGLFLTGMRFEELSHLTWERVDMGNKILQVRSSNGFVTKTNTSERNIPMSNKLYELIKQLSESSTSERVFNLKDKPLKERRMLAFCKTIAEKAKIKKNATLHKFRHSFNSHLAQQGVDYSVREYLMGHKPQSMTDHYTKIDAKKLHKEVSLLDKLIP